MTNRLSVAKTYKMFINGKFPRTESGRYYPLKNKNQKVIVNACQGSRKDFRNAVVAARPALKGWSSASAYLRGQILYRIAELLEGRREQFVAELILEGVTHNRADAEVSTSIDRLVYYAGWADKYQQLFSSVNPVNAPYFNFSVSEPSGVVAIMAPADKGLLGLVSVIAPIIVGGNTCIVLAARQHPLTAINFAEVIHGSDVPAGVVNILTGFRDELLEHFSSHMDVNTVICCDPTGAEKKIVQIAGAENLKQVHFYATTEWRRESAQGPDQIQNGQETKTTWHPIGG